MHRHLYVCKRLARATVPGSGLSECYSCSSLLSAAMKQTAAKHSGSTVAEGAHDAACWFQPGEVLCPCIPLVHLAASGAAVALQPGPFLAAEGNISRPAGSVSPGMPPAGDAVKVRVGQGFAAPHSIQTIYPMLRPAAFPCNITGTTSQQCPGQFNGRIGSPVF